MDTLAELPGIPLYGRRRIRTLWQSMCDSDWDNPQRAIDIPPNSSYTDSEERMQSRRPVALRRPSGGRDNLLMSRRAGVYLV